jgi:hypothetical protein
MNTATEIVIWVIELAVPVVALVVSILGFILLYRGKLGRLEIGKAFRISTIEDEASRIRNRLSSALPQNNAKPTQQYALLQEYHAQGLAQSKISFWFSLVFAAIGFTIIILSVLTYVLSSQEYLASATIIDKAGKPVFAVVAGTIIDAVAGLFFVQSNKARQLMTEFFDRRRVDRKLDESLSVLSQIEDNVISSRVKAPLALNFAEIIVTDDVFRRLIGFQASNDTQMQPADEKK